MDLQKCDPKDQCLTESEILGRCNNYKISFEAPNWTFEGVPKDEMTLKNIVGSLRLIPGRYLYKRIVF